MNTGNQKVLFVMHLPPPVHGVSVMSNLIMQSHVLKTALTCHYVNLSTAGSINELQKNRLGKYFLTVRILASVFHKMLFNRYRYVYVTLFPYGFSFIKDSAVILLARLLGHQTILHLHTYGFREASQRSRWRKRYYQFVFKNAEIICLSALLMEDTMAIFKGRVHILPNGIPQVNFGNTYNAHQEPVNLLFLSNLIRGKGILVLLDAAEILRERRCPFRLRIVGAESDINYTMLKEIVTKKGLDDVVVLVGPKYGEEKHEEFRKAGIFILPSNYDTFGLVLLEAMQFGVPCIGTNVGGVPDILGEGRGAILDEITAWHLADVLEGLINDPVRRMEMSRRGYRHYTENYTAQMFEMGICDILTGLSVRVNDKQFTHPI